MINPAAHRRGLRGQDIKRRGKGRARVHNKSKPLAPVNFADATQRDARRRARGAARP